MSLCVFRVEVPTEKRVKRWALSMEELMSDPTGRTYLPLIVNDTFVLIENISQIIILLQVYKNSRII